MNTLPNERLQCLSAFIDNNEKIIDIGCDHCLLGIYLLLHRENIQVVGSDIHEKPLQKALQNITKYHLEKQIILRKGNGLEALSNDITTIIISGMGGINIVNILKEIKKYPNVSKIVISPNSDFSFTRREISQLGFKLVKEKMVFDHHKYYLISEYHKGYEEMDYFLGKLDISDTIVKNYYLELYKKNNSIIKKLPASEKKKKQELLKENRLITNIFNIDK